MRVDLEEVEKITKRRNEINKPKLDELEIYQNGSKLNISQERIEHHIFSGLNNTDFLNELILGKKNYVELALKQK